MKLLIVEDSNLVSRRLQRAFGKLETLETEIADCLGLALERFRALQPELVVLDIELPDQGTCSNVRAALVHDGQISCVDLRSGCVPAPRRPIL